MLGGDFGPEAALAGKGEFLGQFQHLLGHGFPVKSPVVGGDILHAEADLRVIQGPGGSDGLFGGRELPPHLLDFRIGLQGLTDEALQIRR